MAFLRLIYRCEGCKSALSAMDLSLYPGLTREATGKLLKM
jgi:hypothetical protein